MNAYRLAWTQFGFKAFCAEVFFTLMYRFGVSIVERIYLLPLDGLRSGMQQDGSLSCATNRPEDIKYWRAQGRLSEQNLLGIERGDIVLASVACDEIPIALCLFGHGLLCHSQNVQVRVSPEYRCEFATWIAPQWRGKGVRQMLLQQGLQLSLQEQGKGLLAAININNHISKRSACKVGYRAQALVWTQIKAKGLSKQNPLYQYQVSS